MDKALRALMTKCILAGGQHQGDYKLTKNQHDEGQESERHAGGQGKCQCSSQTSQKTLQVNPSYHQKVEDRVKANPKQAIN